MRAAKRKKVQAAVDKMLDAPVFSLISFHNNEAKSRLSINQAMMTIESTREMPNRWHRFWYKALLDWEWEKVDKNEKV